MKKTVLLLSFFVLLFSACKEDDDLLLLSIDKGSSTFEFTNLEGEQNFQITSNVHWTVNSNSKWCTVNTIAGTGNSEIKVNVIKNTLYSEREAVITIAGTGVSEKQTITVKQAGTAPAFAVSDPTGFTLAGGKDTLDIRSNVTWTVAQDKESKNWCMISMESGDKGNHKFIITAEANNNPDLRKAILTFTANQFAEPIVKEVLQLGENPELSVSPDSIGVSGAERIVEIGVTSNLKYTIFPEVDWIEEVVPATPETRTVVTRTIRLKILANTTDGPRDGSVSFTSGTELVKFKVTQSSQAGDIAADSLALLAIYNASKEITGWNGTISKNWGSEKPINTWYGVGVNADGRVVSLALGNIGPYSGMGVSITADMDFSVLAELTSLTICTRPGSEIPLSIGELSKLERLRIKSAITSGAESVSVPEAIYNLTNLRILELASYAKSRSANFISGEISKDIARLTKLDSLILDGNRITKLPDEIAALQELTFFRMQYNMGNMALSDGICSLGALKKLEISYSGLTAIPTNIGNLKNLEVLNFSNNEFDYTAQVSIPASIDKLTKLTELHINNSRLSGAIPTNIGNLTELTILNLNNNKYEDKSPGLTGEIPASIGSLTKLKTLNLTSNSLTGILPGTMGNLQELGAHNFNITKNKFTGVGAGFGKLKLTNLDFSDNQLTSVAESDFPNAVSINFTNNLLVGDGFPAAMTAPKLTTINFINNKLTFIPAGILKISSLVSLNLNVNPLDAAAMESSDMSMLTNLTTLMLGNITTLTSIPASMATAPALTTLNMMGCRVNSIPDVQFPVIKVLTLDNNEMTTIPDNIVKFTALTTLNANNNKLTTIPAVMTSMPTLTGLYLNANKIASIPAGMSTLEFLFLNDNEMTSIPAGMTKMKTLYINNNKLASMQSVLDMVDLGYLSLINNQIAGTIPEAMKTLVKLQSVDLTNNRLTGTIPSIFGVGKIVGLMTFNVANNRLTGIDFADDPAVLAAFKQIRYKGICPQNDANGNVVTPCPVIIP